MRVPTRISIRFAVLLGTVTEMVAPALATTLEQLTLEEMARKSTAIVRARVTGSHAAARGGDIYTYFGLQVLETWKGQTITEVAIPGGVANGIRQTVTGAPELKPGQEYVLFLWTSRSGLTQVMGLSQGIFKLSEEGSGGGGVKVAQRAPTSELMLDRAGLPVDDRAVRVHLQDLRAQVRLALGAAR